MSDIFEDIFGDVFGGGGRRGNGGRGRERGADLRYNLEITLEEAYKGRNATIKVPTSITCESCTGTGAKPGSKPKTCGTCGGAGRVRATQGFFSIERTCPTCNGRGEVIEDPCRACAGAGRVTRERTLSVNVPAGVEDGTRIRLAGEGEAGMRGAPSGDLYIFLSVKPHGFYSRDGADLFCRVPISMVAAALGTEVAVPTLDGSEAKIKIPEGTQSGSSSACGTRYAHPSLEGYGRSLCPDDCRNAADLTKRQRELLMEFETASSKETSPESAGFFARVKDFFGGASN